MTLKERIFGRKVWKVIDRHGGSPWAPEGAKVQYRRFRRVSALGWLADSDYHLTAFTHQEDGVWFLNNNSVLGDQLWECRGWRMVRLSPISCLRCLENHEFHFPPFINWPKGTHMFQQIMLIRKVATYEP